LPNPPDHFSAAKRRADRLASADFLGDAMQSKRRLVRAFPLPDAKSGRRDTVLTVNFV